MIGSKRKVIVTRKLFLERGWATEAALDRIDMPIGIDIAAQDPAEIAVSIAARMIEVKNHASQEHVAPASSPVRMVSRQIPARTPELHAGHQFNPDYTNDFACASTTV